MTADITPPEGPYFKATRPDGTSFHDQTTKWTVGKITRLRPDSGLPYLSVSTVPTDCTGASWPWRLFEVRPVRGHKMTTPNASNLPNKRGSDVWKVIREVPAHEGFGPQGVHVVALIERAKTLTEAEVKSLDAARVAARYAARVAAWYAAGVAARDAAWDAAWDAARVAARDAAWVATWALLSRDLIGDTFTQNHYDTLTRPWRTTIGQIHPDDKELT